MAVKIFCDICKKEITERGFMCEMNIIDMVVNLADNTEQQRKNSLQICKKCYDDKFKKTTKI